MHGQSPSSLARLLDLRNAVLQRLFISLPDQWPDLVDGFVRDIQQLPPPVPNGALLVTFADIARELGRLAPGHDTSLTLVLEGPSTSALGNEALSRRFQEEIRCWFSGMAPGSLVPAAMARRIAEDLQEHFAEPITLAKLAKHSGWDGRYLSGMFRSVMRVSVRDFLTAVRIDQATILLQQGQKVEAVIASVGWRGRKNFFRHFEERLHVTPGQYRAAWVAAQHDSGDSPVPVPLEDPRPAHREPPRFPSCEPQAATCDPITRVSSLTYAEIV